jgi:hypothetical protein
MFTGHNALHGILRYERMIDVFSFFFADTMQREDQ